VSRIGLHLRVTDSLVSVAQQALSFSVPFFQSFVLLRIQKKAVIPSREEVRAFRTFCEPHFNSLYAHGSLWLNLACTSQQSLYILRQEMSLAKMLGFTHLVVHPGHLYDEDTRDDGIAAVAYTINTLMRYERDIILVLENTAHGKQAVGSDFADFLLLREKLQYPDRVLFCVDTAHAHAYGYALCTRHDVDTFVLFLDQMIGLQNIALIHLNDACEARGSKIDKHAVLGEGLLGSEGLHRLASHEALLHVPIILELPTDSPESVMRALQRAHFWSTAQ
jgi:deoxyribonuclease IV